MYHHCMQSDRKRATSPFMLCLPCLSHKFDENQLVDKASSITAAGVCCGCAKVQRHALFIADHGMSIRQAGERTICGTKPIHHPSITQPTPTAIKLCFHTTHAE